MSRRQDWSTWENGKWGNKRLDKSRYPDIAAAMQELHKMNVHSMFWGHRFHQEFFPSHLVKTARDAIIKKLDEWVSLS